MEQDFKTLNTIYQPLCEYIQRFSQDLKAYDYVFDWKFYNNHSIKKDNEWLLEYYPIPVITIKDICDIGLDIDHTFIECKIKREMAIEFDWSILTNYKFEVYGVEDYLIDFYNSSFNFETIPQKICESKEEEIGITFYFSYLEDKYPLLELIKKLDHIGTYI